MDPLQDEPGKALRGDEWYEFDEHSGLISEIRAYYASPQAVTSNAWNWRSSTTRAGGTR